MSYFVDSYFGKKIIMSRKVLSSHYKMSSPNASTGHPHIMLIHPPSLAIQKSIYANALIVDPYLPIVTTKFPNCDLKMEDEITVGNSSPNNLISLYTFDKSRIYPQWKNYAIINVLSDKVSHQTLKNKLQTIWKHLKPLTHRTS